MTGTLCQVKYVEARDVEQFKAELDEAWKDIRFLHTAL